MRLPEFSPRTVSAIQPILPPGTPVNNPLDLVAGATGVEFKKALSYVVKDPNIDSIIAICVPPVTIDQTLVADAIIDTARISKLPLYACFMGVTYGTGAFERLKEHGIPAMIFPEKKNRLEQKNAVIGDEALQILSCYQIPVASYKYAFSKEEAGKIAAKIGGPVVIKVNTPFILHKTEYGAVAVDLRTPTEVISAYADMEKRITKAFPKSKEQFSVVVQEMITGGVETVIGMTTDPSFGALIMFGLGGIYVEVMKDVSFRIAPLTDLDARDMIKSLKGYKLLTGFRGSKPVNIASVEDSILKLSQLVLDFPDFAEIDINPFIVSAEENATKAVDARFVLAPLK
ncbi:MAG: acetate--CoA ligase family protein [candidate division Zixibacteria bacterium]|nr:acetate--CoA ligase family protein [candidate division Zixibacteria bacterium]